jgi:hypothetical protein
LNRTANEISAIAQDKDSRENRKQGTALQEDPLGAENEDFGSTGALLASGRHKSQIERELSPAALKTRNEKSWVPKTGPWLSCRAERAGAARRKRRSRNEVFSRRKIGAQSEIWWQLTTSSSGKWILPRDQKKQAREINRRLFSLPGGENNSDPRRNEQKENSRRDRQRKRKPVALPQHRTEPGGERTQSENEETQTEKTKL